jgi:hypothetical protein
MEEFDEPAPVRPSRMTRKPAAPPIRCRRIVDADAETAGGSRAERRFAGARGSAGMIATRAAAAAMEAPRRRQRLPSR